MIGNKRFELVNHLGNVLATVTDRKIPHSAGGLNIDYYTADISSVSDYYPFGAPMKERSFNSDKYRFGFNGKENINEMYQNIGSFHDYGMRNYDTRLGRFISVDHLTKKYPYYYPLQFASNITRTSRRRKSYFL